MNIVIVIDASYVLQAGVTLKSFFDLHRGESHSIYCINTNITLEGRSKLTKLCCACNSKIYFIPIKEDALNPFEGIGDWSKYTFMKLLIPAFLPNDVERVLYLDVDMLVLNSLDDIYNIDFQDKALAAVEDVPNAQEHAKRCSLPSGSIYVNSGLMVINLRKWREAYWKNLFIDFCIKNKGHFKINDQDVINSIFAGSIIPLDWKYNVTSFFFGFHSAIYKLNRSEYKRVRKNPFVIHFTNSNKPWKTDAVHIYKCKWFDIYESTLFKGEIQAPKVFYNFYLLAIKVIDYFRMHF